MSFQIPRPASIPGQVKRPGPPGRVPGPQPGARPGLPKPKNPALVGGKPMVPISSLIQFTPYTDPEGASSEKQEPESGVSLQGQNDKETKLNKEVSEDVDEGKNKEKQSDGQKTEKEVFGQDPEDSNRKPVHEKDEKSVDYPPSKESKTEIKFGMDMELSPNKNEKIKEKLLVENKEENAGFEVKTVRQEQSTDKQDNEEAIREKKDKDNEQSALKAEEQIELPPKVEKSSNDAENDAKDPPFSQEESRNMDIPLPDAYSKVKAGPFGIKREIEESAKKNPKRYNEESGEDQEETGYSSPTQTPEIYKGPQEEPRGFGVTEEQPMSIGFGIKSKMNLMGEEIESPNGRVTSYTSKESETRREEDTALLAKLKIYELELEKERNEKAAIKNDQERLLKENSDLKAKLSIANSKLEELSKQETDTKSQDLLQKEEQIKRLKADLKSTMEGSRLITEHSNKVISESTKYKLDTEAIIVSLEQEKEQLHQKFIDYKRQIQQDFITKATSLQEMVNNLEEKNKEYEKEIERLQSDLKQKAQALHKLASLNDNVQDTLSNWPNFEHLYQKPQEEPKISYPENPIALEEFDKSPIAEVVKDDETENNTESQPVESLNNDKDLQEPDTVLEDYQAYDSKAEEVAASRPTILEPEVNTILTVQNDYYQEQKQSDEIVEEPPTDVPADPEEVQPLEDAWNIEEPFVENKDHNQEEEVLEHAWEIKEPLLEDNAHKQEEYKPEYQEEQVVEQGWGVEEPLLEDNEHKQDQYQPEYQENTEFNQEVLQVAEQAWEIKEPLLEDNAYKQEEYQPEVVEQGWGVEEPLLEDNVYKQEEYQPEYQQEQKQEEVREEAAPVYEHHYENQAYVNTEVPPAQNQAPVDVEVAPEKGPELNVRHEIHGEKVSQDALTAPPSHRLPQKKKKGAAPAPKQFVGFKPTQTAYEMPQEPPVVNTQEEPYQQTESYVGSNVVHTNYQELEEKQPETNYPDPEENNIKPKSFYNTTQHKTKPPQFGKAPFGGASKLVPKAKPFYPSNGKQLNFYNNQKDTGIEQQDYSEQPPVNNLEFPVLGEKSTSLGASLPQQDSYDDNAAYSTEENGQYEQGNKYELNGHSQYTQGNGHEQSQPSGRFIPSAKVIKKRAPASGSIF